MEKEKMKFVIRDDDLNFFSKPADIVQWYNDIFAQKIPVGFATIPFVRSTSDVYPNLPLKKIPHFGEEKDEREYPVGNNTELITFVNSNPLIEIIQHGTTHVTRDTIVYEYKRREGLIGETVRGKAELLRAFGTTPKIFAPPHDWIGTQGVVAIEEAGLDVIRGRGAGLRNWLWRWEYVANFVRMFLFRFPHYFTRTPPLYPHVLDFGKHKEACSYRLEDTDVFDGLEQAHKRDGVFVVVTHLHFFTQEKKQRLMKLIEKARQLDAEFVYPSKLFESPI